MYWVYVLGNGGSYLIGDYDMGLDYLIINLIIILYLCYEFNILPEHVD